METVDWIILGVIAVSSLISIKRGFVREALSLVNFVVAIVVAWMFGGQVSMLLVDYIALPSIRLAAAVVMLFVATLFIGALLTRLVSQGVKMSGLGGTDSFLGMCFGLARGVLAVLVVIGLLYYLTPAAKDGWWQESALIPHVVNTVEWLAPMLWEQGGQLIGNTEGANT